MRQGPETLVQNGGPFQGLGLGQDLSIQINDDHHFFFVIQLRSFWCRQSFGQVHVFSCPSVTCFHAGCFDRESPTESLQQICQRQAYFGGSFDENQVCRRKVGGPSEKNYPLNTDQASSKASMQKGGTKNTERPAGDGRRFCFISWVNLHEDYMCFGGNVRKLQRNNFQRGSPLAKPDRQNVPLPASSCLGNSNHSAILL